MARQNRNTLKNFFAAGSLPTEEHFADLIDSSLVMADEGFSKSNDFGLEVTPEDKKKDTLNLISFFHKLTEKYPEWSLSFSPSSQSLEFRRSLKNSNTTFPALELGKDGLITLGERLSVNELNLDVKGALRTPTRVGTRQNSVVLADGKYHSITGSLSGFQALEVVATVRKKNGSGRAILHATALNTGNPPRFRLLTLWNRCRRIRTHQSYFGSPKDRLRLRWKPDYQSGNYTLQIKSVFPYPEDVSIQYHVTKLWADFCEPKDSNGGD